MTTFPRSPDGPPSRPPDGELLAAYLAGDLDEDEVTRLEARLVVDAALRERLDATAAVLVALQRLDDVAEPDGFAERLGARLAAERAELPAAAVSLDAARSARRQRGGAWVAWSGVAAAVLGLAVIGGLSVTGGLNRVDTTARDQVAMEPDVDDRYAATELHAATPSGDAADAPAPAAGAVADSEQLSARATQEAMGGDDAGLMPPPSEPVIADDRVELPDEDAVVDRYAEAPEVLGTLGTERSAGEDMAASFSVAVRRAPAFGSSGVAPSACLESIRSGASAPVIPVRVETVRYDGEDALAYVVVTGTDAATHLHRAEVWIVAADGCQTRLFRDLSVP